MSLHTHLNACVTMEHSEEVSSVPGIFEVDQVSAEPAEAVRFFSAIHSVDCRLISQRGAPKVDIQGTRWDDFGIYVAKFSSPLEFTLGGSRHHHVLSMCMDGAVLFDDGDNKTHCNHGALLPIAPGGGVRLSILKSETKLVNFIIGTKAVDGCFSKLARRSGGGSVIFDQKLASMKVSRQWEHAATCLSHMLHISNTPRTAVQLVIEHMVKILLINHPHNCKEFLADDPLKNERLALVAVDAISLDPLRWKTLGRIAEHLKCSTSSLESEIRSLTGKTSGELFVDARMRILNAALSRGDRESFVSILKHHGFSISNRFIVDYIRRFGEPPSATYRRNRADGATSHDQSVQFTPYEHQINEFIDSSLGKAISLTDISRVIGLSEHETIAAFKQMFAKTPIQYVIERRLERAKWLLRNTSASILSIAIECGFGTQSHLTTSMKKYIGSTPNKIRFQR
ncbi:helix-turn-helix transcriptional regulator [Burkholderia cenocepacia]|uniref:helix-turn-helix transcriptional regulator n=1 Tax=Burkholderia cenocepacia TaxID=95486 RepID=UPI002AB081E7|nr:helix-turn-helix domain-containing protein [Burkholderia cenocepacia]